MPYSLRFQLFQFDLIETSEDVPELPLSRDSTAIEDDAIGCRDSWDPNLYPMIYYHV